MLQVLAAFIFALISVSPASGADTCWVLSQTTKLRGKQKLIVCEKGLRHESNGIVTVAYPPDWSVVLFNTTTKKVFHAKGKSIATNAGVVNDYMIGEYFSRLPMRADKAQKINGSLMNHYIMRSGRKPLPPAAFDPGSAKKWMTDTVILSADMWTLADFRPPEKMQTLLDDLFKLSKVNGVPVKMVYVDSSGRVVEELTTEKIEKGPLKAGSFEVPRGFAKTGNISEVASIRTRQQMDGMAELFGNWRDSQK